MLQKHGDFIMFSCPISSILHYLAINLQPELGIVLLSFIFDFPKEEVTAWTKEHSAPLTSS